MNDYYICEIDNCDEQIRKGRFCHYHSSLTNRPCAWYYHKNYVEWCGKKKERYDDLDCEGCKDHIKPEDDIKLIEKLTGLNQG